jgi:hypothetical protein
MDPMKKLLISLMMKIIKFDENEHLNNFLIIISYISFLYRREIR